MSKGLTLVFGIAYIIMALVSFFGIIGSLFSAAGAVRIFATMLWGFVLVNLVIAIINIISLATNKQTAVDRCISQINSNTNQSGITSSDCRNIETWRIVTFGIVAAIIILFQAYFARVASRFAEQLEQEYYRKYETRNRSNGNNGNNGTDPYSHHKLEKKEVQL
ncbi:15299_t:CDS:2 [Gigaspora rosea]|nr:15299_t:CDS:2 [Gigaspora rosea]